MLVIEGGDLEPTLRNKALVFLYVTSTMQWANGERALMETADAGLARIEV